MVLLAHKDKTLQQSWSFSSLTLNGLVAIIATIIRTALMVSVVSELSQGAWNWFSVSDQHSNKPERRLSDLGIIDGASRGPWASLQLLFRTKGM